MICDLLWSHPEVLDRHEFRGTLFNPTQYKPHIGCISRSPQKKLSLLPGGERDVLTQSEPTRKTLGLTPRF